MEEQKLIVYVTSPDSYRDVLEVFFQAFKRYWSDCKYPFYVTTNEELEEEIDGVTVIANHKQGDSFVDRTIPFLREINAKYILLMNDDIFLRAPVNNADIDRIVDFMDCNDIKYCRFTAGKKGKPVDGMGELEWVHRWMSFGVSMQIGIFKKEYFLELLGDGSKSLAQIENGINSDMVHEPNSYHTDIIMVNRPIVPHVHSVCAGKWCPGVLDFIEGEGFRFHSDRPEWLKGEPFSSKVKAWIGERLSPKQKQFIKKLLR